MKFDTVKLDSLLELLTDYHANGAYKKLKENVELLDEPDYALMIRTTNFEQNEFGSKLKYITEHAYNFLGKSKVYAGDIIMNKIANAGSSYLMPELGKPVSLAMNLFLLRINPEKANPTYVYIYLKINEAYVKNFANGSVTKTITKEAVRNLEIQLPERTIQNSIVNMYFSLSDKIELNRQTNQTLKNIVQAIFKSWFVDFEPTRAKISAKQNGQDLERAAMAAICGKTIEELNQLSPEQQQSLKSTADLFPDALVDSELGEIPEGWGIDSIGNHVNVTKGRSYKSVELEKSNTALVTLKSFLRGGGYREDGLKEYTGTYKPEQVIEPGELVMSLTDVTQAAEIVGKPAIVTQNDSYETLVASLDVAILRPNESVMKEFFYGLMSTYRFHRYAESFATGTTVLHLNAKGITSFEFAQPDIELCTIYSEIYGPVLAKHEGNIHLSRRLEQIRDTLLPKLLSGELNIDSEEAA